MDAGFGWWKIGHALEDAVVDDDPAHHRGQGQSPVVAPVVVGTRGKLISNLVSLSIKYLPMMILSFGSENL